MATTSALAHAARVRAIWGGSITGKPVTVIRKIADSNTWSQHSYGNAIDFYGNRVKLNSMATWAARTHAANAVAHVIRNGRIWSYKTRAWSKYGGKNKHTTHVHIDYLPQWTGTPPGHPTGTSGSAGRQYPIPVTVASPYAGGWLKVIATALWSDSGLSGDPRTASVTRVAQGVVAYNRRHNLSATSFVRADTWGKLGRMGIRRPARGQWVRGGQTFLRNYGYLSSSGVDGIFGPITQQAVRRFQAKAQIRVTGIIATNEWRALWFGPAGWAVSNDRLGRGEEWVRTPEGQPTGEIAHSWEGTLRGLTPLVHQSRWTVAWGERAIRQVIKP